MEQSNSETIEQSNSETIEQYNSETIEQSNNVVKTVVQRYSVGFLYQRSRVRVQWWAASYFCSFPHKQREYWLSLQEADIERD